LRRLPVVASQRPTRTTEQLFREQFLPLYPPGVELGELRRTDANPAGNAALIRGAQETAELFAKLAPDALQAPDLELDFSDASIHRLSVALTVDARERLLSSSGKDAPSLFVHLLTHGALYIAATIVKQHEGKLILRNPLWESSVELTSRAGVALLSPFWWLLRSWSDDGAASLADRYRMLVEVPSEDVERWPVLAPPDRRLPRLGRVRYDLLFQHLKQHLPELTDFGEDFPPPARFEELGFRFMEFALVGEGRLLLLHGQTRAGVHLFWLNRSGFVKAAFFEADPSPEHRLEQRIGANGTSVLHVELTRSGERQEHEMLWWGP
jgi:hypothetical protein